MSNTDLDTMRQIAERWMTPGAYATQAEWDEMQAARERIRAELELLRGERDADEGRITPYEQARRELGLALGEQP